MITFSISLVLLVLGYFIYGKFVEKVFGPDDRPTPAITKADGVDFIILPNWRIFMIQFLNIAGTGPIFGAIMGAKFGPVAYIWIVLGCIFAGAVHDYLSGMLSLRHDGANLPNMIGTYLGNATKQVMLIFSILLLLMVGAVFVYSPAEILTGIWEPEAISNWLGKNTFWIVIIFIYYIIATMLPIDKIIGKIYPLFAFSLIFMAVALMVMLYIKMPNLPEIWDGIDNMGAEKLGLTDPIFPCLFITIACGAISGFHATQSPLMARCIKNERHARPIFYGAMITEGLVALIWATVSMYFFYNDPTPGYETLAVATGANTSAPSVVNIICNDWLGVVGGILALLGVVAAPITSGDTALRSARLIIADFLKLKQHSIRNRLYICVPMFACTIALLIWQMNNPNGFSMIWNWFGWSNQTLSVFTLWMLTVYLARTNKPYIITLIPALFMTTTCATFLFTSKQTLNMGYGPTAIIAGASVVVALCWFFWWNTKKKTPLQ